MPEVLLSRPTLSPRSGPRCLLLGLVLLGCAGPGTGPAPDDTDGDCPVAGPVAYVCDAAPLDVGTGEEAFEEIPAGGWFDLVRGTQGYQHIFLSARFHAEEGRPAIERAQVEIGVWLPDAVEPAEPLQAFGASLYQVGDQIEVLGARYVFVDEEGFLDRPLVLTASVHPVGWSAPVRALAEVRLRWAEGQGVAERSTQP